jgi:hypothetical protein
VQVGIRPIRIAGIELAYIDFGHANFNNVTNSIFEDYPTAGKNFTTSTISAYMQAKAPAAFGVVYVPLPTQLFDIYGKAGIARPHIANSGEYFPHLIFTCGVLCDGFIPFRDNYTDTRFAYGGGAQVKFA